MYIKAEKAYAIIIKQVLPNKYIDRYLRDQLKRAVVSILLNIAEGAGKFSKKDKKNFYTIARGSTQESVAIIRILGIEGQIPNKIYDELYTAFTDTSKMLSGLINSMIKEG